MPQHDFTIADAPGQPVRLDLQAAVQALATCSAGATAPAAPFAGMLWLDTSVSPNGQLKMRDQANAAWISIAGFPAKASTAEVIAGTDDAKFATSLGIAQRERILVEAHRNRLVNPALQISQQNGDSIGSADLYYPADQWVMRLTTTGTVTIQRLSSVTPKKSRKRLQFGVQVGQAVLGAGDRFYLIQAIEGIRTGDFGWGAAGARQVIVRFGFKGPAGQYSLALRNGAANRSYTKSFVIAAGQANTDTEQVIVIPGDVTGTWPTDNNASLYLTILFAAGSSVIAAADGVWSAGSFLASPGQSNGLNPAGNVFELFDLGLYLDVNNTGVPPLWEMPDEAAELLTCQRYYCTGMYTMYHGGANVGSVVYADTYTTVDMRIANPAMSGANISGSNFPAAVGTPIFFAPRGLRENRTASGTGTGVFSTVWTVDARM